MIRAIRATYLLLLAGTTAVAGPASNSPLTKLGVGSNGGTLSLPMEIAISLTLLTLLSALLLTQNPQYFAWSDLWSGLQFRLPGAGLSTAVAVFGSTGVGASA